MLAVATRWTHSQFGRGGSERIDLVSAAIVVALVGIASVANHLRAQEQFRLPGQDRHLIADFEELYRVGAPDVLLSDIRTAEFAHDGTLYLLDALSVSDVQLMAVTEGGKSVRTIGQPGGGPGEFRGIPHFSPLSDGRLAVFDLGHNAYHIFSSEGVLDGMVDAGGVGPAASFGSMARSIRPDRLGTGFLMVSPVTWDTSGEEWTVDSRGRTIVRIRLNGPSGVETDTVLSAWTPPYSNSELDIGGQTLTIKGGLLFEPQLHFDALAGGDIAYVESAAYEVKVANRNGRLLRIIHRPFGAQPVTDEIRKAVKEQQIRSFNTEVGGSEFFGAEQLSDLLTFYHEIPVVEGLKAGWSKAIWVQRRHPDVLWRPANSRNEPEKYPPGPVDVLSVDGEYIGTFAPDEMTMPLALGPDGLVATAEYDDFGVPTLVVRRLPEALR